MNDSERASIRDLLDALEYAHARGDDQEHGAFIKALRDLAQEPPGELRTAGVRRDANGVELPRAVYEGARLLGYLLPIDPPAEVVSVQPYEPDTALIGALDLPIGSRWSDGPTAYQALLAAKDAGRGEA